MCATDYTAIPDPSARQRSRVRLRAWLVLILSYAFAITGLLTLSLNSGSDTKASASFGAEAVGVLVFLFLAPYLAATIIFSVDAHSLERARPAVVSYLATLVLGGLASGAATVWVMSLRDDPAGLGVIMLIVPWYLGAGVAAIIVYFVIRTARRLTIRA